MLRDILIVVGAALVLGTGNLVYSWLRRRNDSARIHAWLSANTKDEPNESHRSAEAIANRTGIPKHRVVAACLADTRIFQSKGDANSWSVWREEPESIYNRRRMLHVSRAQQPASAKWFVPRLVLPGLGSTTHPDC